MFSNLILLTNKCDVDDESYVDFVLQCVHAGVNCVQLHEKHLDAKELYQFAKLLHHSLQKYKVPLIINDNVELCLSLDADGVHLGQSDCSSVLARRILGKGKIIGLSVNDFDDMLVSNIMPIDYIGVGAIFPTKSKKDVKTIWGLNGLEKAVLLSKHPIVAIGGITENNVAQVIQCGADAIAAIDVFHSAVDLNITTTILSKNSKNAPTSTVGKWGGSSR